MRQFRLLVDLSRGRFEAREVNAVEYIPHEVLPTAEKAHALQEEEFYASHDEREDMRRWGDTHAAASLPVSIGAKGHESECLQTPHRVPVRRPAFRSLSNRTS